MPLPVLLSGSPVLDLDASVFIYLGIFGLAFLMLRALIFRPVIDLMDAREEAIDGAREEAKALQKEAAAKLDAFEKEMSKVKAEAAVERDRLRAEGLRLERSLIERVRGDTEALVQKAEGEMADEAKKARAQIASATPTLAKQIAERLLGREVKA